MRRMQLRIPQAIPQLQKMPIKMVDRGTVVSYGCDFINNIYPFEGKQSLQWTMVTLLWTHSYPNLRS